MGGSTRATLRGGALRWHGRAQPARGKMTPAKWRALRLLARRGLPYGNQAIAPQTRRALVQRGLIRFSLDLELWVLTEVGRTALERYEPRRR